MTTSTTPTYSTGTNTGIAYDFSPFLDRMASALETIAIKTTSIDSTLTAIKTDLDTIATNTTGIKTDLDTMAANSTIMAKLAQGYTELITTISATGGASGQNVINTLSNTSAVVLGQIVSGTGVPFGTSVTAFTSTSVTLSNNLTATASGTYNFYKSWVGIHTIGPYDWLGYASLYHLYVEQGKLTADLSSNISSADQAAALTLLQSYLTKIRNLPTLY